MIKNLFWIGCLAAGLQSARAFSLLGPVGSAGTTGGTVEDNWQITDLGYDPLPNPNALPGIGTIVGFDVAPKQVNEGYRYNTPVIYYTFDPDFVFFGSDGESAVIQAMCILNGVLNGQTNAPLYITSPNTGVLMGPTNGVFNGPSVALGPANGVDKYSTNLTEFPLDTQGMNYQAGQFLGLTDLKSTTLALMLEQLGLGDAERYTWGLMGRWIAPGGSCTPTTPPSLGPGAAVGVDYWVIPRNIGIVLSSLTNYQYSPYVNGELYKYYIWDTCGAAPPGPPTADALEIPVDPLSNVSSVASGTLPGEGFLPAGGYYTGLTRDDVAGLRWLLSTNNIFDTAPGYQEQPAGGSVMFSTNTAPPFPTLSTSNYNALVGDTLTNGPAALQALYPALQFALVTNYYSNVVSQSVNYVTNYNVDGGIPGQGYVELQTTYTTNLVEFYQYNFGNVATYETNAQTTYKVQTITVGPPIGWPVGTPFVTNVSYSQPFQSNVPSGDYFIIANGTCGPHILQTLQTNVIQVTNLIAGVTNADRSSVVKNLISYSTNHLFEIQPCTLVTNAIARYQGIGRIEFIRVSDDNYDYLTGQFRQAITNQYTMVVNTNYQCITRTFQRVVTRPDILFGAQDLIQGTANGDLAGADTQRSPPNFIDSRAPNLAGPGIIDPTTGTGVSIIFNTAEPVLVNSAPGNLLGPIGAGQSLIWWGSFDGTTNPPVVYPNGTSIQNLAAEMFIHISPPPPNLPAGTVGTPYSLTFSATGGQPLYTWSAYGLPEGLTLSSNGVISGTPTQSGTFNNIVIQMTDSTIPSANVVDTIYSLTIN